VLKPAAKNEQLIAIGKILMGKIRLAFRCRAIQGCQMVCFQTKNPQFA
jgi:hypothetical protein